MTDLLREGKETMKIKVLKIRKRNALDVIKLKVGKYFVKCDVDGEIIEVSLYDFDIESREDFRLGILARIQTIMIQRRLKSATDVKKFEGMEIEGVKP